MSAVIESADFADLVARLARADLAGDLTDEIGPEALIDRVLRRAIDLVPGATDVGVTMVTRSGRGAPVHVATGALVDACALLEDQLGEGPGHHAIKCDEVVQVDDLANDARWPVFAARASALGVGSLLVTPLPSADGPRGTFTACSGTPKVFATPVAQVLPNVANRVAIALAHADMLRHMRRAIDSRTTIGQACGILIERHKIRPEEAFEQLVRASQCNHLKLRDLAARVVETGQEPAAIRY
jgi:GAF domain-containing protein